jgi:teichuronic acid biosynthesis glycosyltransferase TuaC
MTDGLRVVVVARAKQGQLSAFVGEQIAALENIGVDITVVPVNSSGLSSYLRVGRTISSIAMRVDAHIVHAHYGLTGLAATRQHIAPTVITFHGSDLNSPRTRLLSQLAAKRASAGIYVSTKLAQYAPRNTDAYIVPCAVNPMFFDRIGRDQARAELGIGNGPVVLFASSADIPVKNYGLAVRAINRIDRPIELLELKNRTRSDVRYLLAAADALLLTSFSEGSPQVVKEALAMGCPIVATDVGDVRDQIGQVEGCFVTKHDESEIAQRLVEVLRRQTRLPNALMHHLHSDVVASQIVAIYQNVIRGQA